MTKTVLKPSLCAPVPFPVADLAAFDAIAMQKTSMPFPFVGAITLVDIIGPTTLGAFGDRATSPHLLLIFAAN